MKYLLLICIVATLFAGCIIKGDRTDAEMFEAADKVFQNYLFEYGIDSKLFITPIIEEREDGMKSYKWLAFGSEENPAGVDVLVAKSKDIKPKWILIGNNDAWLPLVNTVRQKNFRQLKRVQEEDG